MSFPDYASEIRLLHCSKLAINRKYDNDVTICRYDVSSYFLMLFCFWSYDYLLLQWNDQKPGNQKYPRCDQT